MNYITIISILSGLFSVIGGIVAWFKFFKNLKNPVIKKIWTISLVIFGLVLISGGVYHYISATDVAVNYVHDQLINNYEASVAYVCPKDRYAAQQRAETDMSDDQSLINDGKTIEVPTVNISGKLDYMSDDYALIDLSVTTHIPGSSDPSQSKDEQIQVMPNGLGWCIPYGH